MQEVRWERMFPDQLEAALTACPVVYLPYGLCEPHGPQNAVGLDALKAHAICCRAAEAHGGIVAPPDYWHIHEIGLYASWAAEWAGEARPWLTALPPWQHFKNVCYHLRAVDALGFHAAILLLTGHYGPNWEDLAHCWRSLQPHFATRSMVCPILKPTSPALTTTAKRPVTMPARSRLRCCGRWNHKALTSPVCRLQEHRGLPCNGAKCLSIGSAGRGMHGRGRSALAGGQSRRVAGGV
ncbi:MAG: creatininase family protein [Caldilineaceae bacterium]